MIVPYNKLQSEGYVFCLPGQVKLNTGTLGSYLCALKTGTGRILLRVNQARLFLESGYMAVDDNGTPLTLLDPDLDMKLVVTGDLHLYFALRQDPSCLGNVWVDVIPELPKGRRQYY